MFNILLSIVVCAAARMFFARVLSGHVYAPYVIAGNTHELKTCLFKHFPILPRCLANAIHPAVILL